MDISADLTEMSKTSVAIVSAGIKSILDIGKTLEYLETMGIPVVTLGQDEFPSFYSVKSGQRSPLRMDSIGDIAAMMHAKWNLGLEGSILVANPVPTEFEVPMEKMEVHISAALTAAEDLGIKGKDVTPFLLKYLTDHTRGESLESNIALIRHNAEIGAALAKSYSGKMTAG
jgi:pseudouridine-5'-phosphate glycosidase